ncbi:MAG: hypothetical protein II781_00990 [Clostridia bacterium]|nr:hypothetical protein [Clostridia bacterium]
MIKNKQQAGADQRTPSVPQYFSWINNTNEGSTEKQTLVNLDFFRYMKETYGMEIRIYAWDAGNFDGSAEGYGNLNSDKFQAQYPEGYKNVVAAAEKLGIRMGLWGSPDGFGDDPETEKERFDFYVHLCRDYHFALFKIDGVCGQLRPEKAGIYARMLQECRRYSPDLIVLNHRLKLYEAEPYVTTYLFKGNETYVDVHLGNDITCMHNRAYMFHRGHTENLDRLAEDHGVCISSSVDYFEDELVYQAFGRSLILAPEIYGNPWFMRDNELPKLARVYNLHKHNAPILVDGMLLPASLGCDAVSRGTGDKRFLCTGNDTWETRTIEIALDESIGLTASGNYLVNIRHPYEEHLGCFPYGSTVTLPLLPFRATLVEVSVPEKADPVLTNCRYEMIRENADGIPETVKYLVCDGKPVQLLHSGHLSEYAVPCKCDIQEKPPVFLGALPHTTENPSDGEALYEAAVFPAVNDSLEYRTKIRSGESRISEVNAAREAFFNQKTYILRGCEASAMFDGDPSTFFDTQSRIYQGKGFRIEGGCLRIDCRKVTDADTVEIEFFNPSADTRELKAALIPTQLQTSCDLHSWETVPLTHLFTVNEKEQVEVVRLTIHTLYSAEGKRLKACFRTDKPFRYLRMPCPPDRIYAVRAKHGTVCLDLSAAHANNLQAPYSPKHAGSCRYGTIQIPPHKPGSYVALAVEGAHGVEGVYCGAVLDGENVGFPHRAPDYKANVWEARVLEKDRNNTFSFLFPTIPQVRSSVCGLYSPILPLRETLPAIYGSVKGTTCLTDKYELTGRHRCPVSLQVDIRYIFLIANRVLSPAPCFSFLYFPGTSYQSTIGCVQLTRPRKSLTMARTWRASSGKRNS